MVLSKSEHAPSEVVEAVRNLLPPDKSQIQETLASNIAFLAGASAFTEKATKSNRTDGEVLLVEDHQELRTAISSSLDRSGFTVTGVESHNAALCQVEAREFDAFLVNRLCPDGIGLSLCTNLRRLYPQTTIVMYSTATLQITQEQRLQAGANAYLTGAAEILNPGPILSTLIEQANKESPDLDSKWAGELELTTN
jgi:CheY-like chemotaxis protein